MTLQAFKKATHCLLHGITELDSKVRAVIKFWNDAPKISLKAALDFQIKAIVEKRDTGFTMMCCSLESETDQVSFLWYFFTKALYEDHMTTLGSIAMGRSNDSIGVKQLFENCMEAAPSSVHYPFDSHYFAGCSVMECVKLYFEEKIKMYMNHIWNGSLVFTPKLGCVSSENQQLANEIKKMQPYVISWSNVIDYISPKSFHAIAKQMSGPETVHIIHSCNWTTRVYGTDVFDINVESRLFSCSAGLLLMESSHGMSEGFSKHCPYHFQDICTIILGRKSVKKFLQYLFKGEHVNCGCLNGNTPLKAMNPLARNHTTAHFVFAYEQTGIMFGMDSYDFLKEDE